MRGLVQFTKHNIQPAIEPIRAAEVTIIHSVAYGKQYIGQVKHPGISMINGDIYHMQSEESHIGMAIVEAGDLLVNLHFADSNVAHGRRLDQCRHDYSSPSVIGYNREGVPSPLSRWAPATHGRPNATKLDALVRASVRYFRECEEMVLAE